MGFIIFAVLVGVAISLVESFVIAFIASLLGINISFKNIFFVVFIINLFMPINRR